MKQLRSVEAILRRWEDRSIVNIIAYQLPESTAPVWEPLYDWEAYRESFFHFRKEVDLTATLTEEEMQDAMEHFYGGDLARGRKEYGNDFTAPFDIVWWLGGQSSVYHITPDTHAMLNMTSLGDLRWKDVVWPQTSFMIAFDAPMTGTLSKTRNGEIVREKYRYDGLLIRRMQLFHPIEQKQYDLLSIRLLATEARSAILSLDARDALLTAFEKKKWPLVRELLAKAQTQMRRGRDAWFTLPMDQVSDAPVSVSVVSHLAEVHAQFCNCGGEHPEWDQAAKLAVTFAKYLSIAPHSAPFVSEWQPAKIPTGLHPLNAVTEARVCTVHCKLRLSQRQREMMLACGHLEEPPELKGHTRKGYFHRPAGKGHLPDWPRSEYTLPSCPNIENTTGELRTALEAWLEMSRAEGQQLKAAVRKRKEEEAAAKAATSDPAATDAQQ